MGLESFCTLCRVSPSGRNGEDPPPLLEKLACPPHAPHCFDPKIPILSFSCSFWPFCPNCPLNQSTPFGKPCCVLRYNLVSVIVDGICLVSVTVDGKYEYLKMSALQ